MLGIGMIMEDALRETLLCNPFDCVLSLTLTMTTMGAASFIDFVSSYFVELCIMIIERLYLDPFIKHCSKLWPRWMMVLHRRFGQVRGWGVARSLLRILSAPLAAIFYDFLPLVPTRVSSLTNHHPQRRRMTREEKAKEEMEWRRINEEIELESEGVEPLMDSYVKHSTHHLPDAEAYIGKDLGNHLITPPPHHPTIHHP
jgi:hypothetical protein